MNAASLATTPPAPRQRLITAAMVAVIVHAAGSGVLLTVLIMRPPQLLPLTIGFELVPPANPQSVLAHKRRARVRRQYSPARETWTSSRTTMPAPASAAGDTVPPSPLHYRATNPRPRYPLAARRRGMQGRVLLGVLVNEEGEVARLFIKQSCGYRLLDDAALRAVRQWRFRPARRLGRPVPATVEIPVRFVLQGNRMAQN